MAEPAHDPVLEDDTLYLGLYLDAQTEAAGAADEGRLSALALQPFTFDIDVWHVAPGGAEALSCPDPHRAPAPGDARAPGIDLARAHALIERAHLVVTHTGGFSRALLDALLPALVEVPWLEWQLGIPDFDGSVHHPDPPSRGLSACRTGLMLLAQRDDKTGRPWLSQLLAHAARMPQRPRH